MVNREWGGGVPSAIRPEQAEQLPVANRQVDAADCLNLPALGRHHPLRLRYLRHPRPPRSRVRS
ncbi:hypothetical protein GAR05_01066 [Micromonospora saelicesensis]|uniref:Uncharacterized protein n=1 Tax=Micromonospora saelicesensis TaxID=285676 RepID=A0ABX9CP63_9ACTN|nr:hypothetical protein GAR05_01066 [Micromonospora saelicesensis]